MKNLLRILFIAAVILLQSCQPHQDTEPERPSGNVTFSLNPSMIAGKNGRVMHLVLPPSARLIVSIETMASTPVVSRDTLNLLMLNDQVVSVPVPLEEGEYALTELLLIGKNEDGADEIFYAAPSAGHPLENVVEEPLPIFFTIAHSQLTSLSVEVVEAFLFTPEDLGFFSVDLHLVNHFFVAVSIPTGGGLAFTDATAAILQGEDTLAIYTFTQGLNMVKYSGYTDEEFTLVITKSGYAKYVEDFTIAEIDSTLEYALLQVFMEPALTFIAVPEHVLGSYPFSFTVYHEATVDWGDGTVDTFEDDYVEFYHEYEGPGNYFVSVTGDLEDITRFYSYYGQGPLRDLNLMNLPNLDDFRNGWNGSSLSPATIDFSYNKKLEYLDVSNTRNLERLIIPEDNHLSNVNIFGPNNLTEEAVDNIIGPVYESAVANNRQWGIIYLEYPSIENSLVPVSPGTLSKLKALKNTYGWTIEPDPDLLD